MLARVRTIGKDLYQVQAFVKTPIGPQWKTLGETKYENLALDLEEYVRYYATRNWVTRRIKNFEAAKRTAQDND